MIRHFHSVCFSFDMDSEARLKILAAEPGHSIPAYLRQMIRREYEAYQQTEERLLEKLFDVRAGLGNLNKAISGVSA